MVNYMTKRKHILFWCTAFCVIISFFLLVLFVLATVPTHNTPILNSTDGTNNTNANITVYNISTADADGDSVVNIIDWRFGTSNTSRMVVYLEMTGGSNLNNTRDYSSFNHTVNIYNTTFFNTSGSDGRGMYNFTMASSLNHTYMNITAAPELDLRSDGFMMCVRTMPTGTSGGTIAHRRLNFQLAYGTNNRWINFATNTTGQQISLATSQNSGYLNTEHIICVANNGTDQFMYVDKSTMITNRTGSLSIPTHDLILGCRATHDQCYNGTISMFFYMNGSNASQNDYWIIANLTADNITTILTNSSFKANENQTACITPNDIGADGGTLCSNLLTAIAVSAANGTPTLEQVVFNVTTATKTSGLSANTTYSDPTGDLGNLFFRAFRNNTEILTQNFTSIANKTIVNFTISVNLYNRSDMINITVYANDGGTNTSTYNNSINISNTAPLQGTPILNSTLLGNNSDENLTAFTQTVTDADNDGITTYYEWFRNTISFLNTTTNILSTGNLSAGQLWQAKIRVSDLNLNSSQVNSNTLSINYLNISLFTPENGSRFSDTNKAFTFNVTAGTPRICSLFDNDTGSYRNVTSISTILQNGNNSVTHNSILENYSIAWNIECITQGGTRFFAPLNFSLAIDRTNPIMSFTTPVRQNTTLLTTQSPTFNSSCTDQGGLFEHQVNITNSTGQSIYLNLSTNLTGTQYNFTPTINFSNNATGVYRANYQCSDDHTASTIDDYDVAIDIDTGTIEFNTTEETIIGIDLTTSDLSIENVTLTQEDDRYSFSYDYDTTTDDSLISIPESDLITIPDESTDTQLYEHTYTYHLTSTKPLIYRNNSRYNGHFVTGRNWIDFAGVEGNFTVFENNTGWYVQIDSNETSLNFSSIGGLNIVEENITFSYGFVNGSYVDPQTPTNASFVSGIQSINITGFHVANNITLITIFRDGINVTICTNQNWCNFTENVSALLIGTHGFNATIVAGINERNITILRNYSNALNYTIDSTVMGITFGTENTFIYGNVPTAIPNEARYRHNGTINIVSNATQNLTTIYVIPTSRLTESFGNRNQGFDHAEVDGDTTNVTFAVYDTNVTIITTQHLNQGIHFFQFNYSTYSGGQTGESNGGLSTGGLQTAYPSLNETYLYTIHNITYTKTQLIDKGAEVEQKYDYTLIVLGLKKEYLISSDVESEIFLFYKNASIYATENPLVYLLNNESIPINQFNVRKEDKEKYYTTNITLNITAGKYKVLTITKYDTLLLYNYKDIKVLSQTTPIWEKIIKIIKNLDYSLYSLWLLIIICVIALAYIIYKQT